MYKKAEDTISYERTEKSEIFLIKKLYEYFPLLLNGYFL